MGLYEKGLGTVVIPGMIVILVLIAFVPARRQLNQVMLKIGDAKFNINGINIKILPCIACINLVCFYAELQKIHRLDKIDEANGDTPQEHSRYLQEYYMHNRNALLNVCSALLIMQMYLTGARYETYKVVKDKADEMRKREAAANK